MPDCPNGHGLLVESVSANGNGNDTRDSCPECDYEIIGHTLYPHNDPEHPRYKYRHGLSGRQPGGKSNETVSIPTLPDPPAEPVSTWRFGRY